MRDTGKRQLQSAAPLTDASGGGEPDDGPNLTPVLDTLFLVLAVLLVVFVKLTPVEGLPAVLGPDKGRGGDVDRSQRVEVTLLADGGVEVNGQPVAMDLLPSAVRESIRRPNVNGVFLLAHSEVPYGTVAEALAILQRSDHPPVYLGMARRPIAKPDPELVVRKP
jgi:biopolymer transport protein ExbD